MFDQIRLHAEMSDEELANSHKRWLKELHENKNNFSYWYPRLNNLHKWFKIPSTGIFHVPDALYDDFFLEKPGAFERVESWVEKEMIPLLKRQFHDGSTAFLKNGCYSGKFDFNDCCKVCSIDTKTLTEHILRIEQDALAFDTMGDLEFIVREYINPVEGTPEIYNGMPLRCELRAFVDFDSKEYLYDVFYWDKDYCYDHLPEEDRETFLAAYDELYNEYLHIRDYVRNCVLDCIYDIDIEGRWSIDILYQNGELYFIDAAVANRSAYWDPYKIPKYQDVNYRQHSVIPDNYDDLKFLPEIAKEIENCSGIRVFVGDFRLTDENCHDGLGVEDELFIDTMLKVSGKFKDVPMIVTSVGKGTVSKIRLIDGMLSPNVE